MKFIVQREAFLKPLMLAAGNIERRQTLPILSNVLLDLSEGNKLSLLSTDLEVEVQGFVDVLEGTPGKTTLPARKLIDICRNLPQASKIELSINNENGRALLKSGKSRFSLSTMPAHDFPRIDDCPSEVEFSIAADIFRTLLFKTQFAMANQDVRYYLNGLLLESDGKKINSVTTDGHRLAQAAVNLDEEIQPFRVIIPRRGIAELMKLLNEINDSVELAIANNYIRLTHFSYTLKSKLIEGDFPDYHRVVPKGGDKIVSLDRELFQQVLARVSILSNEKHRGIRLKLRQNQMLVFANNPDQEEAEESIDLQYDKDDLDIGFNVTYLLDVLSVLSCETIKLIFSNSDTSVLIEIPEDNDGVYVVMPMLL